MFDIHDRVANRADRTQTGSIEQICSDDRWYLVQWDDGSYTMEECTDIEAAQPAPAATPEPPPIPTDGPVITDLEVAEALSGIVEQPIPVHNDGPSMHDLVDDDLGDLERTVRACRVDNMARRAYGHRLYGTILQVGSGRDFTLDAYQEAQDLLVYLKGSMIEREQMIARIADLERQLAVALEALAIPVEPSQDGAA